LVVPDDPRIVIVSKIIVHVGDNVMEFDPSKGKFTFQMPEKTQYDIKLQFYVQRDIVSCLKYINVVSNKMGIKRKSFGVLVWWLMWISCSEQGTSASRELWTC
jgi:hypothetical protein